jgi:hypothetical protein
MALKALHRNSSSTWTAVQDGWTGSVAHSFMAGDGDRNPNRIPPFPQHRARLGRGDASAERNTRVVDRMRVDA